MYQKLILILPLLFVTSCSLFKQKNPAPVESNETVHMVQKGETLYSIAWRYHCDFREIALLNQIPAPYTIYPSQKIRIVLSFSRSQHQLIHQHHSAVLKEKESNKKQKPIGEFNSAWSWPVKGNIIKHYSSKQLGSKGIDIRGRYGQPIKAAASGKVVYAGGGLRGYGQLLIIKHNDLFLSAYAHNSRMIVKEGEIVTRGQVIAYMGNSDSQEVKLHFEIRKRGIPINPLDILPPY